MQAAARARGYDLSQQRARQVTAEDFHRFDLILAMDSSNLEDLQAIRPADATAELSLYLSVLDNAPTDVPDPYYTRDFDGVLDLIERAARAWAEKLA
jgi:protein-tyrosine phosphatase